MVNNIELGIFISILVVSSGLLVWTSIIYARYRKAVEKIVQLELDKITLTSKLSKALQDIENHKLGETEEFVQFLSKSRQWAFDFIEGFQSSLDGLFQQLEADPDDTQKILAKFLELKQYLPDEKVTKEK
ncbi:MAG: hypothetical protein WAO41_08825 [Candidatus Nanopelagicales bacterium]